MNVSRHTRPLIYAEAAEKGGGFSAQPALQHSEAAGSVWGGKVPPGIVWQMVWSEASGLRGWSWKRTSAPSTFGLAEREASAEWAQPQQRCHLWSPPPPHDDHVQRQAPQPEMWVPDVCWGQRRLLMLSTLCCWVSDASSLITSFVLGFLGLNVGTYSSCLLCFLVFSWFDISLSCVDVDSFCINIFFFGGGGWKVNLICRCTMELFCPFWLDNGFPNSGSENSLSSCLLLELYESHFSWEQAGKLPP